MKFIADLHIHSHYSIATSKQLIPEYLDLWGKIKGIQVVGTGDFTHPGWLKEMKEKLEPAEEGLFRLKPDLIINEPEYNWIPPDQDVRFILSAEISNIYKKDGKVRKVHNVVLAPDFYAVEKIQHRLDQIGNITSDGRPILGLDSKDLLEICLEASEDIFFIPAHIWTPWFSALGAKSGFDTIDECYADLSHHIHAIETGLSSDPPMNWICSFLDRFSIISNSDAHSPEKLGREANLFDTEMSYPAIVKALRKETDGFKGTYEFFPQEGKYHLDGHRKCRLCWDPLETLKHDEICPVCGKKVTVGVLNRVAQLADRETIEKREDRKPYWGLIPLKELLAEIHGVGPNTKTVRSEYAGLIHKLGPELEILLQLPLEAIHQSGHTLLAEGIRRMREREVCLQSGYDGEFGIIRVFKDKAEMDAFSQSQLFTRSTEHKQTPRHQLLEFDLKTFQTLRKEKTHSYVNKQAAPEEPGTPLPKYLQHLNQEQRKAVCHPKGPALILAGPGTGKTRVLTSRFAWLVQEQKIKPEHILAITFTRKAAAEMCMRIKSLFRKKTKKQDIPVYTFHGFGYDFLKTHAQLAHREEAFILLDHDDKYLLLQTIFDRDKKQLRQLFNEISSHKQKATNTIDAVESSFFSDWNTYENELTRMNAFDLDDLIYWPVKLLKSDSALKSACMQKYRHLLVDEYQDVNSGQYELLCCLSDYPQNNLFVIGDPNQAIYGFRGSDVKYIEQFRQDYPEAAVYSLAQSYRCTNHILKASGQILNESNASFLKGLEEGIQIAILDHETDKSEAEFIARAIENLMGGLRFFSMDSQITEGHQHIQIDSLSDFAVLCRTGHQIKVLKKAFADHSIPYQCADDLPFYQEEPFKAVLQDLKSLIYPELASASHRRLHDLNEKQRRQLSRELTGTDISKAIRKLVSDLHPEILKTHSESFNHLCEMAQAYENNYTDFFKMIMTGTAQDDLKFDVEKVSLLTLHASKGLEFACVFIPGCEANLLPYSLFRDNVDSDEERRLLYVGMTRARHLLFLSHAKKRQLFGRTLQQKPSPFITDIKEALIQKQKAIYQRKPKKDEDQMKLF